MRLLPLLILGLAFVPAVHAQKLTYKFYGQVRADLFYDSRDNKETADGMFYMYPKDHDYDADGKDLNAYPKGSLYALYTRMGVDIGGVTLGKATVTGKIEADYRGSGSALGVVRLRQAFINIDFGRSSLLMGQTWHPMTGDVMAGTLNLSSGAPFQPFNRSPMVRYRYTTPCHISLTAAAIWQFQNASYGPDGASKNYQKNGCVPEVYVGFDYRHDGVTAGGGVEVLSMQPRRVTTDSEGNRYKVSERVTSVSAEAHVKYTGHDWILSARTTFANNITQCSMLGGFAATAVDPRTDACHYTPFRHIMTWLSAIYGRKWQPGLFVGYLRNLGTAHPIITDKIYGDGVNIGSLFAVNAQMCYVLPHWKFGVEFTPCTAWYGQNRASDGMVKDTHAVTNYRVLGVMLFTF